MSDATVEHATCLGCGCLCDDIRVEVRDGAIARLEQTCPLGDRWFGDGVFPTACRVAEQDVSLEEAIAEAATLLFAEPGRLLIYVAGDLACETHREAVALADRLGAAIDGPASDTVADGLLAAQRRGRAAATLGELRHRADAVLFWGVDPDRCYPRFLERFVTPPPTLAKSRSLVAVDVGTDHGPAACPERLSLDPADEVDAVRVMQAVVKGRPLGDLPPALEPFAELACRMTAAAYAAIVFDAEPGELRRDPALTEALITFTQTLNGPTRAALFALRAGGNRNGYESLLTWQTGYSFAVDFAPGYPTYRAEESVAQRLARGRFAAALVVGSPATVPPGVSEQLSRIDTVAVGSRASEAAFGPRIAIDTGAAGIHDGGLVLRMDDVPLQVRPVLSHPHSATDVLRRLAAHIPARTQEVA